MEAHPVTESLSSPSLELQAGTDQTSFRAKRSRSLNDVTLLDETQRITPDIILVENNKERYRFRSAHAGLFQCSVTGLVFKMATEGDVTYRTVMWYRKLPAQLAKRPAGPLFEVECPQRSVRQLRFPHCEVLSAGGGRSLSVVHVMDDDGIELIKPHVITETHAVVNVDWTETASSLFGLVTEKSRRPGPVQALVSLFYTPPFSDEHPSSVLKMLLLPRNVVMREALKERRALNGEETYIENPPCELTCEQQYTLSTSPQDRSTKIQPSVTEFEIHDTSYGPNYIETFEVMLKWRVSRLTVRLRIAKTSSVAWERDIELSAAALRKRHVQHTLTRSTEDRLFDVRSSFISSVSGPVLDWVLGKLFHMGVIIREEYDNANVKQARQDKARYVIDTVRNKGTAASSSMILILCETDQFFSKYLGLM